MKLVDQVSLFFGVFDCCICFDPCECSAVQIFDSVFKRLHRQISTLYFSIVHYLEAMPIVLNKKLYHNLAVHLIEILYVLFL